MKFYLLIGNSISAHTEMPNPKPKAALALRSINDLDAKRFPLKRINDIWMSLAPKANHKPFKDRASGVRRLWQALEQLPCGELKPASKISQVIVLMKRPEGASIEEIAHITDWQPHSIRGAISGHIRKKLGLDLMRVKDGERAAYKIT